MKSLCLILFLALSSIPACSHSSGGGRPDRTYAKHLKKMRLDRTYAKHLKKVRVDRTYAWHLKKMRVERDRRRAQWSKAAPELPPPDVMVPSEPQEMVEISEGPMAVPGDLASE
ncbi:MAG TPA: hypothetical protein VNP98_04700 [Chthoniobacterales bacterium]|nr:hypothetical protein [Chthoniobacterales bacterium]